MSIKPFFNVPISLDHKVIKVLISVDSIVLHRKFQSYVAYFIKIPYPLHDYFPVHKCLNLNSLTDQKQTIST